MADQPRLVVGTVVEEAARLIEAMATMARPEAGPKQEPSRYAEEPAHGSASPDAEHVGVGANQQGGCSACGGGASQTSAACRICPLCQGIAMLRSVRPETVERLADLASAMAATLRDLATQSRASGTAPHDRPTSGGPAGGSATVQDIHVADESEG